MLDAPIRRRIDPVVEAAGRAAALRGAQPGAVTAAGLIVGVGACLAAGLGAWWTALGLWLANRALDGLDGAVARARGASDFGGLLDFAADYVVYGGFVLGVAIARPDARVACAALLATYLVNVVVLLSLSSLLERRGIRATDPRALRFTPGLAEGTETIAAYVLICLLPGHAEAIASAFAAMVLVTVAQRLALARRLLGRGSAGRGADVAT